MSIALIDGDILCYRVGFTTEDEIEETALRTMSSLLQDLLLFDLTDNMEWEIFLTGKKNFRHEYAVTVPYKGNRKDVKKPKHLQAIRQYLVDKWEATVSDGQEADDDIAIRATELGVDGCIIVSIDKDFLQVPGWHYNFMKREKKLVTPEEGIRFFYKQILMGDSADNIQGAWRVGTKTADKLLADAKTEQELYQCCVEVLGEKRVLENARLLWLRRTPNEIWEPPKEV